MAIHSFTSYHSSSAAKGLIPIATVRTKVFYTINALLVTMDRWRFAVTQNTHRAMLESLGSFALGHLDHMETERVRAHLDGCDACRSEYHALTPLAVAFARRGPGLPQERLGPGALLGAGVESETDTGRTHAIAACRDERARSEPQPT